MALTEFDHALAEVKVGDFIEGRRPPEDIRKELDLGFRIEDQSIYIFEIRPHFRTRETIHIDVAKTTYVKSQGIWKLYWHRADGKWHSYEPTPEVKYLDDWLDTVDEDKHCCFWG